MEPHYLILHQLVLLFLALTASQATLPPQVFWNSMLPNTPMPKTIKDLLRPNLEEYGSSNENGGGKNRFGDHGFSHANVSISYDASKNGDDGKTRFGDRGFSHANVSISYDASKNGNDGKSRLGDRGFSHANVSISYDADKNGDGKNRFGDRGFSHANVSISYDASKNGDDGKNRLGDRGFSHANVSISYDADKNGDGKNRLGRRGSSHANISISYDAGENGDGKDKLDGHVPSHANVSISYDAGEKGDGKNKLGAHGSHANISISYDGGINGDGKIKLGSQGSNNADVTLVTDDSNVSDGGEQFQGEPKATVFFLLEDLVPGTQMNLDFPSMENDASFLPRHIADSIPFSSNEFPEILNKLSIKPESTDAKIMETTIKTCEQPGIKGEHKVCATSLESMIDFTTSDLGKQVQAVSSEVQKVNQMKKYKFMNGIKKLVDDKSIVCHKLNYPYAVFYCHAIPSTSVYMVPLEAIDDGSRAKAIAVCHKDTSAWNPNHVAFEMVKVKPGTLPICHFPEDSVIWSRK